MGGLSGVDLQLARSVMSAPTVDITSSAVFETNRSCDHFSCVDVVRCGGGSHRDGRLMVHVPPAVRHVDLDGAEVAPVTRQYLEMLDAVLHSVHYTPDPEDACIILPPVDCLRPSGSARDVGRALSSSSLWNGGMNHLVLSMIPGSAPIPMGNAILAGAGLSWRSYRDGFDVAVPTLSSMIRDVEPRLTIDARRKEWLVIAVPPVKTDVAPMLRRHEKGHGDVLVLRDCSKRVNGQSGVTCAGGHRYPQVLAAADFCLVTTLDSDGTLAHGGLVEAMHMNCIPVFGGAEDQVLPFSEKVDWTRFAVFVRRHKLPNLVQTLASMPRNQVTEMKRQLGAIYDNYFRFVILSPFYLVTALSWIIWDHMFMCRSPAKVMLTTLRIVEERLLPYLNRPLSAWNDFSSPSAGSANPLFLPHVPSEDEGFTAVILTYNRLDSLFKLINRYS